MIERLIGIYNAKGSLSGEVSYFFGKLAGTRHCALCDITHGIIREKSVFVDAKSQLDMPFETLHLDELDDTMAEFAPAAPCILAVSNGAAKLFITNDQLISCHGSVDALLHLIGSLLGTASR